MATGVGRLSAGELAAVVHAVTYPHSQACSSYADQYRRAPVTSLAQV